MRQSPATDAIVELVEHEERFVRLEPDEAEFLWRTYPRVLDVRMDGGGRSFVKVSSFVGSVMTPYRELRIKPKCPASSLFYMLGWAYGLASLREEAVGYKDVESVWEFLVALLIEGLERLVKRDLHRGYVERERALPALRGRLLVEQHLRRMRPAELTLPCRFEELTPDTVHNQVVRFTLHQLPRPRSDLLGLRLHRLRSLFSFAHYRAFTPKDLGQIVYDRLSEHYRPVHSLCRLLLEGRGLDHPAGSYPLGAFLLDMNVLFERFVAGWLRENMSRPYSVETQMSGHLDFGKRLRIRPDLVISRSGKIVLVADTKYKSMSSLSEGMQVISSADAYQVVSYCRALGIARGALIYPEWSGGPEVYRVRDGETSVTADGVDLGQSHFAIDRIMRRLCARLSQDHEPRGTRSRG